MAATSKRNSMTGHLRSRSINQSTSPTAAPIQNIETFSSPKSTTAVTTTEVVSPSSETLKKTSYTTDISSGKTAAAGKPSPVAGPRPGIAALPAHKQTGPPPGGYYIQDIIKVAEPHHKSVSQLWYTKWQRNCKIGVYPFSLGAYQDFEPIMHYLIAARLHEPYDWEQWAAFFYPTAENLAMRADEAARAGERDKARELYHRSCAVYRISRYPVPRTPAQKLAWKLGKEVFLRGAEFMDNPVTEVNIPHEKHRVEGEGNIIPVYYTLPPKAKAPGAAPVPLLMIFSGLDGFRTELACYAQPWADEGCATLIVEIPGTGDCPVLHERKDPASGDRLYNSVFDWIDQQDIIDKKKIALWAFSTGGYHAMRVAHTHKDRFAGVVNQGGGVHYMFEESWLNEVNHLEYPFDLTHSIAWKLGYNDDEVELFKKEGLSKFSLLHQGILDMPHCKRLLMINGTHDSIYPVDDQYLSLEHGIGVKECKIIHGRKHMGVPDSDPTIVKWLFDVLGIEKKEDGSDRDPRALLMKVMSKPKYV